LRLAKQDGSNFAEIVQESKEGPEVRRNLGIKGKLLVLKGYTWQKNAEKVVRHIEGVRKGQESDEFKEIHT